MDRVGIVAGARTPFGKATKGYRGVHPVDLLATAMRGAVAAAGVDPESIDRALVGCTHQIGEQSFNIGRNAWLAAGFPELKSTLSLDAQCCSGQEVVNLAHALIGVGSDDVILAGGVESLTSVPSGSTMAPELGNPYPQSLTDRTSMPHQSEAVELMAAKYGVTRADADQFGVTSHLRAAAAWADGVFDSEVVFVDGPEGPVLTTDEGVRGDSSVEKAAQLRSSYVEGGIVNAANASQLSDGAAAVVVASESACGRLGLTPDAWITATASVGADPALMLEGPIHATRKVLDRTGLSIEDIDVFEVHEAFAVPVLVWMREYGIDPERVNLHGGAISLGHPFGASGTRQIVHLSRYLQQSGKTRGLQVMCGGGGLGVATLLERA